MLLSLNTWAQTDSTTSVKDTALLDDIRVQTFYYNAQQAEVPLAVSTFTSAALERYGSLDFVGAMNTIPGVKMDERSPGSYRISIRGNLLRSTFGVRNVKVYWNGIPFTDAHGNTYFNQIGATHIGKIEIAKGPAGSMYGAGTSGVILLSNETLPQNGFHIRQQISFGSQNTQQYATQLAWKNDQQEHALKFSHLHTDGYRHHSAMNRTVLQYYNTINSSMHDRWNSHIFLSHLNYQTPGGLTAEELKTNPRLARPNAELLDAQIDLKTAFAGLGYQYSKDQWQFEAGGYVSHTRLENPTFRNYEVKNENGVGGRMVLGWIKENFNLRLGSEIQYGSTNKGLYGNRAGNMDTLQNQDEVSSFIISTFLHSEWKWKTWKWSVGASVNHHDYEFDRFSEVGFPKMERNFKPQFIPRIALYKSWSEHWGTYVSFSRGYSPPSMDEVYADNAVFNRDLEAEVGNNFELGLKWKPIHQRFWGNITGYYFEMFESIASRRDATGGAYFENAGRIAQWGLEGELNYALIRQSNSLVKRAVVQSTWTINKSQFKSYPAPNEVYRNNFLPGTPKQQWFFGLDLTLKPNIKLYNAYSFTSSIALNDANTVWTKEYHQWNFNVQYETRVVNKWRGTLFAQGQKTWNTPYGLGNDLNAAVGRFFNPSAPWKWQIGIAVKILYK